MIWSRWQFEYQSTLICMLLKHFGLWKRFKDGNREADGCKLDVKIGKVVAISTKVLEELVIVDVADSLKTGKRYCCWSHAMRWSCCSCWEQSLRRDYWKYWEVLHNEKAGGLEKYLQTNLSAEELFQCLKLINRCAVPRKSFLVSIFSSTHCDHITLL